MIIKLHMLTSEAKCRPMKGEEIKTAPEARAMKESRIKIFPQKQMLQRLLKLIGRVQASKIYENLLKEIRQIPDSLY